MSEFDDLEAQIEALHTEAEDLRDAAALTKTSAKAAELKKDAARKVRQAARLRSQMEARG